MASETRLAFLEESVKPLAAILGEETVNLQPVFLVDRLTESLMGVADHGALYVPVGKRRPFGKLLG